MENWQILEEKQYYPNYLKATEDLPPAAYRPCYNDRLGLGLEVIHATTDTLYPLPSPELVMFMAEVDIFLKSRQKYEKYGFTYKRGAIMYGKPGNGKSMLIEQISREIVKQDGMTIFINNVGNINMFVSLLASIRDKNPKRFIVVVMEELDLLIENADRGDRSTFLNLLDGGTTIDNVLYLATTNNPERLTENIYNRPSRFDLRIEVKNPTKETILSYLEHAIHEDDRKDFDLEEAAEDLVGQSLAAVKEFVIGYFIIGNPYDEILDKLNSFKAIPRNTDGQKSMGFASPALPAVSNGKGESHMVRR